MPGTVGIKAEISKAFKLHGYQLRVEASRHLEQLLTPIQDRSSWIEKILDHLGQKDLDSAVLDKAILDKVIKECSNQVAGDATENVFNVIDAFETPRFTYSLDRKKFLSDSSLGLGKATIFADADAKARIYLARYEMLQQRTSRHRLFASEQNAAVGNEHGEAAIKYALKTVDFLLGTNTKIENVIVLGMLTMLKHGVYSLEDPTGSLDLDMTEAKFHKGLYTENCFVLVEGWYEDRIFHVVAMGHPPIETSEVTRSYFGSANFFGGPLETSPKADQRLAQLEAQDDSAMMVFLSDVWLDKPEVMTRLKRLFVGYSAMPPTAFIFMGNFMSSSVTETGPQKIKAFKEAFKNLGEILSEHKELTSNSKFIFIPGPQDPAFANIYPRPSIPTSILSEFCAKVPNVVLGSNPCRVQIYTQEVVIFREDIMSKMCRNCVYFPEGNETSLHFARTILAQGHLAPLPLHNCPVHWDHDRAMWMYPLPDLVVIGDKLDHFTSENINGCTVVNPGSFGKNDFSFKTYVPKLKLVEDSQVPDEDYA